MAAESDIGAPIILVEEDMLERIRADIRAVPGREERGGILLGTRRGRHFHIVEATLPQPRDRSSRFAFHRAADGHRQHAIRRWQASRGTIDWLGEWHSHPERQPAPSGIDLRSWRHLVARRKAPMLFIILGEEGLWMGLMKSGRLWPIRYVEAERSPAGIAYLPSDQGDKICR